jgi:D-galactarolactone cycloisomerase
MKIKEIKLFPLRAEVEPFASATGWRNLRETILVEIITDEGFSGWGEAKGPLSCIVKAIEENLAPIIINEDPLNAGVLWEKMQIKKLKGTPPGAIGGIDMALWDLKGKILNVPVYQLLGGCFINSIQPYATALFYHSNKEKENSLLFEEEAQQLLDLNFKAIKMKVGFGIKNDVKRVRKLRELAGKDFPIMVDANQSYGFSSALELGKILDELGVVWFEEPMPWISISAYKELGRRLNLLIAGGEIESNLMGFVETIKQRSVQIIQPDPIMCGGITPCQHIASLAKASQVVFCPHCFGNIVNLFACIHLTVGFSHYANWTPIDRPVLLEWDATKNPLVEAIVENLPRIKNGIIGIPQGPGLGINIDRKALGRFLI